MRMPTLSRRLVLAAPAARAAPAVLRAQAARRPVMIYSGVNEAIHTEVVKAFEAAHPQFEIKAVLGSTGPAAARAIAERANPQADAMYGMNQFYLEQLKRQGVFAPHEPKGSMIAQQFRDGDDFFVSHWLTVNGFLVNTRMAEERRLAVTRTWAALADPMYKGLVSAPSPVRSGTGLTVFTAVVDAFGWEYLDRLHLNIPSYGSGGSVAARQAAAGELMIGITFDTTLLTLRESGAPVEIVFPDMVPNITEGGGLIARGPNPEGGRAFCDFCASPAGAAVFKAFTGATTTPGVGNLPLADLALWTMKRPIDADEFRREWSRRYER